MLVRLARKPKAIAWLFMTLIYVELMLTPVIARAGIPPLTFAFNRNVVINPSGSVLPQKMLPSKSKTEDARTVTTTTTGKEAAKIASPDIGGPTQPEMTAFSSVNSGNMVDLFTGDFNYTIPLLDVGGYPVTLGYSAGIGMDQEASWVGLGWNINPGTITRNLRGLPDDFKGDVVKKTVSVKENKTVGVMVGANVEIAGFDIFKPADTSKPGLSAQINLSRSLGIVHNNYKGWGIESAYSTGLSAGKAGKGQLSAGLSTNNSSMEGLTVTPSVGFSANLINKEEDKSPLSVSLFSSYNSRSGLGSLQLSTGISYSKQIEKLHRFSGGQVLGASSNLLSFYTPATLPSINIPYNSFQFSFTGRIGIEEKIISKSVFVNGYVTKQYVSRDDSTTYLPSYGYLNYQHAAPDGSSLLDYNREKELPFREKPAYPHIAVPSYTYDAFSISGEGTGGMFRPYRPQPGFIHDPVIRTKSESGRVAVDLAFGDMAHQGLDIGPTISTTRTGPWLGDNYMKDSVRFTDNNGLYQSVYFKNPSEKAINPKEYYKQLGGDDLVTVELDQRNPRDPSIVATSNLIRYRNGLAREKINLRANNPDSIQRSKRTQVITYLTAQEGDATALNKYIENFTYNVFDASICALPQVSAEGDGTGLKAELFGNMDLSGYPAMTFTDRSLWHDRTNGYPLGLTSWSNDNWWSVRWTGRFFAPETGTYQFSSKSDDGFYFKVNGKSVIDDWRERNIEDVAKTGTLNLEAGQFYEIEAGMYDNKKFAQLDFQWKLPNSSSFEKIPIKYLYPKAKDTFSIQRPGKGILVMKEKRVNDYRKPHHISEISVLNSDGRRYVYGIPVYNLIQKDVVFTVGKDSGNLITGMTKFSPADVSTNNKRGKDNYFSREELPAYAHSFLLTGILSDDYSDLTGNGISEDDPGDAVKFNYSKVTGYGTPFKWRTPAGENSASYSEGLRTDYRDDKGTYVYGEKEMWYLHSIESKTMVATFFLSNRKDMPSVDEFGKRIYDGVAKRLDSIKLFSKADYGKYGVGAKSVKTVHFRYSYELCRGITDLDSGKLTLKSVWFTYNGVRRDSAGSNPYKFRYHNNNPRYNTQHSDRWGVYKDPAQNPGSVTGNAVRNAEYPFSLQDSAQAAYNAGAWNLDGIDLPSGGSLKIEYESDDYGYVQNKRAMQMFQIAGFSASPVWSTAKPALYGKDDNRYVFIKVPSGTITEKEVYEKYLAEIDKLFFQVFVKVPKDNYNNGQTHEYVKGYAALEKGAGSYGVAAPGVIWVKMKGLTKNGEVGGSFSPIAIAALQFLKINLPSKAFPGSETGDELDLKEAISVLSSIPRNVVDALVSYESRARGSGWVQDVDLSRSFVRLWNPQRKKYGGGYRIKRVTLFDNWDKMTNQRPAKYGQEYIYTITEDVNKTKTTISSGVASYEPGIGGEENPFRMPIEYIDQPSVMLPSTRGYTEEPLGEAFFPAPGVGYSRVRVRTINHQKKKSANGYDETCFYTAKDYPVFTERTLFDASTFKRYKPSITNFLRIVAYHYLTLSQGFKVELNDMHGKIRSQASYPEVDTSGYINYTEYFYRSENTANGKRLRNTVMAIDPSGKIDTAALIGKSVELMMDMREQESVVEAFNLQPNTELFSAGPIPAFIAMAWNFFNYEQNRFRSVATVKLIQRSGILDSVVTVDKGRRLSTADLLYDAETGDVLMTRTQNAWKDYVYNFTYPSHWAYNAMGPAYRNIDAFADHVDIRGGKIVSANSPAALFSGGDEILVGGKQQTGGAACTEEIATFPNYKRIWCVDSSDLNGGQRAIYFINRDGSPYNGFDISMKVVRSGSRNMFAGVGSVSSLDSLMRKNPVTGNYELSINDNSKVLAAAANEFSQFRKVEDIKLKRYDTIKGSCPPGYTYSAATGNCVKDTAITITKNFISCQPAANSNYTSCGSYLYTNYTAYDNFDRIALPSNKLWRCLGDSNLCKKPIPTFKRPSVPHTFAAAATDTSAQFQLLRAVPQTPRDTNAGPMNRALLWWGTCPGSGTSPNQYYGFTVPVTIPHDGNYYIGMGADNLISVSIDNQIFRQDVDINDEHNFQIWHIQPKYFTRGVHLIRIDGRDSIRPAGLGLEIYDNTQQELQNATDYAQLNLIFSTKDLVNQSVPDSFSCPLNYSLAQNSAGNYTCRTYLPLSPPVYTEACFSIVTDTSLNPYLTGVLGNWKSKRVYTLYQSRRESDPTIATNIRKDGVVKDFIPYWAFQQNKLKPTTDTTKWVWNNESTIFNKRGLELENKDPLGRFNAGIYGYERTLPVAVVQNSRYRESAFDGFEDYHMTNTDCSAPCAADRHFDFGNYRELMDTTEKHTGKRSLKLTSQSEAGILAKISPPSLDTIAPKVNFLSYNNTCASNLLKEIKTGKDMLLPIFTPATSQQMVISAWVKESQDCKCTSYQNSQIRVVVNTSTGSPIEYIFTPSGSIIEGWQRIDSVFTIPANATSVVINMRANGSYTSWFDDLRVHPFNANMKSFVYHPVNLRLMAELDENNYASLYEYDDEGTLIRVKKETVRGVKTIKETRSAMAQQ